MTPIAFRPITPTEPPPKLWVLVRWRTQAGAWSNPVSAYRTAAGEPAFWGGAGFLREVTHWCVVPGEGE